MYKLNKIGKGNLRMDSEYIYIKNK